MQGNITAKLKFQTLKQAIFEITFITGNIKTIIVDLVNEIEYSGSYKEYNTVFRVHLKKQPLTVTDLTVDLPEPHIKGIFYCDLDNDYNYNISLWYFPEIRTYKGFITFIPTKEASEKI
jgi:hypothetical protein